MNTANRIRMMWVLVITVVTLLAGGEARAVSPYTWAQTTGGPYNWDDSNWGQGVLYPSAANDVALVTANLTANLVINLGTSITVGSISVGDPTTTPAFSYTIQPSTTQTITLDNGASTATIKKSGLTGNTRANDTISANIILNSDLTFQTDTAGSRCGVTLSGVVSESGKKNLTVAFSDNTLFANLSNANNSYSGKTTVNRGVLQFASIANVGGSNSSLGAPANATDGTIAIGSGANGCTLQYTGATTVSTDRKLDFTGTTGGINLNASGSGAIFFTAQPSFSGTGLKALTLGSAGSAGVGLLGNLDGAAIDTVTIGYGDGASGPYYLLGANTYAGVTTINRATLVINSIADADGVTATAIGAPSAANGSIAMTPTGAIACGLKYVGTGHSSSRGFSFSDTGTGTRTLDASGNGKLTLSGTVTNSAASNKTLALDGTGEGELSGVIYDAAANTTALTKGGSGTWTVKGDNKFTGTVTLSGAGGRLIMGHANTLGLGTGAILLTAGTLDPGDAARTIANPVTLNNHTIAGTNNMTFSGTLTASGASRTLTSSLDAGRTLTLTNVVLSHTDVTTFYLYGTGDTTINGVISESGTGAKGLTMSGLGTLALKGANTYTGTTTNNSGTILVDYSAGADMPETALTLAGGTLKAKGKAGGATTDTLGAVTVSAGGGALLVDPNGGGGTTLTLGTLTASVAGGSALFGKAAGAGSGTVAITTTTGPGTSGIYPAHVLFTDGTANGYDWATGSGSPYTQAAFSAYATFDTSAGRDTTNRLLDAASGVTTMAGSRTNGTLKIQVPNAGASLDLAGYTLSLTNGGLLVTGGNAFTITNSTGNGRLSAGNGSGAYDLIIHQYNSGGLTIHAIVTNGASATALTKAGSGPLVLNAANGHSGGTYVNQGIVEVRNSSALGTAGSVYVKPGASVQLNGSGLTLARTIASLVGTGTDGSGALKNVSGANTWSGAIMVGTGGARIGNADTGNALTLSGGITTAAGKDLTLGGAGNIVVSTTAISGAGAIAKDGAGTTEWSAVNTATGPIAVNAGTLKVTSSIANGAKVTVNSGGTLSGSGTCYGEVWVKSGGTIRPEGGDLTVSNLVLFSGCTNVFDVDLGRKIVVSQAGDIVNQQGLTIMPGAKVVLIGALSPNTTNNLIQCSGWINGNVTNLSLVSTAPSGSIVTFITNGGYVAVTFSSSFSPPVITNGTLVETSMNEDGGALNLSTLGLAATDPTGSGWVWTNVAGSGPANGTVAVNGTGTNPVWTPFTYQPYDNFYGTNTFDVKVTTQDSGLSDTVTVRVVVNPVNDAPTNTVAPGYDGAT